MESYAEWIRERTDVELRTLLTARPELIFPVPADLSALAARATTASAAAHALDRLDRFHLAVLEAALVLPQPVAYTALRRHVTAGIEPGVKATARADAVRRAVDALRAVGLLWGPDRRLRTAPGVRQALPHPAGLGPPVREAFAGHPADRLTDLLADLDAGLPAGFADTSRLIERLEAVLAEPRTILDDAGDEARTALEHLIWGPPAGRVENARRPVRVATATTPVERLLARGLLAAADDRTVVLPREVALALREPAGALFRDLRPVPPPLDGPARDPALADRTAAGQAFTTVRLIADLLERWGLEPPPALRSGGLSVRDLRATAGRLELEEWHAALLMEVAYAAGLLARSGDVDGDWLPTRAYDLWLLKETADRWADLATAWLETDRVAGLAGERDDRDRVINALTDDSVRAPAPDLRRAVLGALAEAEPGTAPGSDTVRAHLTWLRPRRRGRLLERMVGWTVREAEVLGLTGFGALASYARPLLDRDGAAREAVEALMKLLPEPGDRVLIQADLTAVAPGPLVAGLARELALMADVESTGGATVYRFTAGSIRRALDAGRSAAELADLLTRHSATPVPQPLTYLIDDMARRHGRLRVGTASSYVRTDDPSTLDEILADRRAESMFLHRLAPTVLASRLTRAELLEALRGMGLSPVAESPEGGIVIMRVDAQRAEAPSARVQAARTRPVSDASMISAAVRALKAGDEAARHGAALARDRPDSPGEPPRSPAASMVGELRSAVETGGRLWIGYLDQQGRASSRIVEPIRVEGGFLTAYDQTRAAVHRFALHRITGAAPVEPGASSPD